MYVTLTDHEWDCQQNKVTHEYVDCICGCHTLWQATSQWAQHWNPQSRADTTSEVGAAPSTCYQRCPGMSSVQQRIRKCGVACTCCMTPTATARCCCGQLRTVVVANVVMRGCPCVTCTQSYTPPDSNLHLQSQAFQRLGVGSQASSGPATA